MAPIHPFRPAAAFAPRDAFLTAVLAGDVPAHPAALAEQTVAALMPVTLWYEGEELGRFIAPEYASAHPATAICRTLRLAGSERVILATNQSA
jgi:hypothetical protein